MVESIMRTFEPVRGKDNEVVLSNRRCAAVQHEVREAEMVELFRRLRAAYADAVSNPFQARFLFL